MTEDFRALLQAFIRRFGLLESERTPCGHPLAPSDAHALMLLRGAGDAGLPQAGLAAGLGVDKSTASRLVARLARRGHVASVRAEDGRQRPVRLTAKGGRLADIIESASQARFAALLGGVPEGRRPTVVRALRDIVQALGRLEENEP